MTTNFSKLVVFAAIGFIFSFGAQKQAEAQFSKAVVLLKGTIHMDQTGKAYSAKISIRSAENQNLELSAAKSNSETGDYLIVLQPSTKYVIHIEGQGIADIDETIETPAAHGTIKLTKDFTVGSGTAISTSQETASVK